MIRAIVIILLMLMSGCMISSKVSEEVSGEYKIIVNVSGLTVPDRIVLQNNGGDDLEVNEDGQFEFSSRMLKGSSYNITISEQPSHHNCEVQNGSGEVLGDDVDDIEIVCSEKIWIQDAYLKASNAGSGDLFGYSVAVDGDIIVVGAISEDSNYSGIDNTDGSASTDDSVSSSGAVYVFKKDSDGNWVQDAYLKASSIGNGDEFGYSVSISGDIIVVGDLYEDSNSTSIDNTDGSAPTDNDGTDVGAAYVFKRGSDGDWVQDAYLKPSNANDYDKFGYSVAVSGDIIVVATPYEDSNLTSVDNNDGSASSNNDESCSGAAYVFKKDSDGNWIQDAYLKASNSEGIDNFGVSVAVSGDIIVVGAWFEDSNSTNVDSTDGCASGDNSASDSGAAYVFKRDSNGIWVQDAYLKAPNTGSDDRFGYSVAVDGDIIVVGAFQEDSNSTSVDNTDGSASSNNGASNSGAAYVFKRDSNGDWVQDAYLKTSNADPSDNFGQSVAVSGDVVVVGAYWEDGNSTRIENTDGSASSDNSRSNSGAAYVFKRDSNGNWVQDAYLKASNAGADDRFGEAVAISGDTIVIGAHFEDSSSNTIENTDGSAPSDGGASSAGAAYVFKRQ